MVILTIGTFFIMLTVTVSSLNAFFLNNSINLKKKTYLPQTFEPLCKDVKLHYKCSDSTVLIFPSCI